MGPSAWEGLVRAEQAWQTCKSGSPPARTVVFESSTSLETPDWDVVICGGTLGILLGTALVERGWRVAVVERGQLRGRDQEWNTSRQELVCLVELGLLSPTELEAVIASEYPATQVRFSGSGQYRIPDVLNIGVDPVSLLARLLERFRTEGGVLLEQTDFLQSTIHPQGVAVTVRGEGGERYLRARLLIDGMGQFSPIVRQLRRGGRPDGVCLVVGSCATGYRDDREADLMATITGVTGDCQYFWEAFPARDGRTTYLFTYVDADPRRGSLTGLFEDYLRLLPDYQGTPLEELHFQRALYSFFPAYRNSPLRSDLARLLLIGDASAQQSPLSFGGFGSMLRHLPRLVSGVDRALEANRLDVAALQSLQPYQPNIAVTWLFQRAMCPTVGQNLPPEQINRLLGVVFEEMAKLGPEVLKPFLQDAVRWDGLTRTMLAAFGRDPLLIAGVVRQVGLPALVEWLGHYLNLGLYAAVQPPLAAAWNTWGKMLEERSPELAFEVWARLQAVSYGSGQES
ncbi:MAG: FAD-binding oxidoreductase [Gemmatimonadaceae bacterium]|nr:FAD-binding oxidoreductase [Gloeobacterales cyanobacterium ES-bin-141]